MGTTLAEEGSLLMGDQAFFRIASYYRKEMFSLGLIQLRSGQKPEQVAERLHSLLPKDVRIVTRKQFFAIDRAYWAERTPIGFIISTSMVVGLIMGGVIIYQILYADVSDHLPDYATLKGIGLSDRFFLVLIVQQSIMLSICGFFPGVLLTAGLYKATLTVAYLPTELRFDRLIMVFIFETSMCAIGGALGTLLARHRALGYAPCLRRARRQHPLVILLP